MQPLHVFVSFQKTVYARYPTQLARTFVTAKQINWKELENVVLIIGLNSLVWGTFLFN